jgi:hypothetical protein
MASGSTLVRGAVIVTVMNWEYSLSPSSLNTEAEVSQLMLAGRAGRSEPDNHDEPSEAEESPEGEEQTPTRLSSRAMINTAHM